MNTWVIVRINEKTGDRYVMPGIYTDWISARNDAANMTRQAKTIGIPVRYEVQP